MEEESLAKVRRGVVFLFYFQGRLPLYPQVLSEKDGVSSAKFNEASSSSLLNLKFLFREGDGVEKVRSREVNLFYVFQGLRPLYPTWLSEQDGVSRKKYWCFLCMIEIFLLLGNGKGGDDI